MKEATLFFAVVTALASCTQGREIQALPAPLATQRALIQTLPPLETLPGPVQTSPAPLESGLDPQNRCTPGTSWQEECNTCHCTSNGLAACTLALCVSSSIPAVPSADRCTPGTTWMQDCNTCRCTASGVGICTMMMCLRRKRDVGADAAGDVARTASETCAPGSSWQDGCNSCLCMENGERACTDRACGAREGPEGPNRKRLQQQRCLAGSVWSRDCNVCRCTAAGEPACTRRACPPNRVARHAQRSAEQGSGAAGRSCMLGSSWRQDCNSCTCLGGRAVCTQMACLGSSRPQLP